MGQWFKRLRFLWEEETPSPKEVPRFERGDPAGVPGPVRRAARFSLLGMVAVTLTCQVIGVRLVAPVDAAASYTSTCVAACRNLRDQCRQPCTTPACRQACQQSFQNCQQDCHADGL